MAAVSCCACSARIRRSPRSPRRRARTPARRCTRRILACAASSRACSSPCRIGPRSRPRRAAARWWCSPRCRMVSWRRSCPRSSRPGRRQVSPVRRATGSRSSTCPATIACRMRPPMRSTTASRTRIPRTSAASSTACPNGSARRSRRPLRQASASRTPVVSPLRSSSRCCRCSPRRRARRSTGSRSAVPRARRDPARCRATPRITPRAPTTTAPTSRWCTSTWAKCSSSSRRMAAKPASRSCRIPHRWCAACIARCRRG